MTNTMRAAAGIAIVAIVGVGVLAFNFRPSGSGTGTPTPTAAPTPTTAPTPTAAPTASPGPWAAAPGIPAWTTYTSETYGITFGYPDSWRVYGAAARVWQPGDDPTSDAYKEVFVNSQAVDGDDIAMAVWQRPAGSGADITSRQGLAAWFEEQLCDDQVDACETVSDIAVPMCVGQAACLPAVLVPFSDSTQAVFADAETGLVTVVSLARPDGFPAAARYGGAVQLLKSILTTMDVWTPEPGQVPE